MRRVRDRSSFVDVVYEAVAAPCAACGHLPPIDQHRSRPLQGLKGHFNVVLKDRACQESGCPLHGVPIRPVEEAALPTIRSREYGLDIVTFVGEKRTEDAVSLPSIHKSLVETYGVHISERHVSNLYQVFLALVHCVNADFAPLRQKLEQQGHLVLAVDGVSLDDVSNVLYVIRDVISSEVLYSERVPKKDGEHLAALLEKVKALGIPIKGVVSDKEHGLVAAVEKALPGVPHALCQLHFLKNAGKPMEDELPELSAVTTQALKQVKQLERDLQSKAVKNAATAEEIELVRELSSAARTAAKVSGDPILGPAPLKRYNRMSQVLQAARKAQKLRPGAWALLTSLISALSVLDAQASLADRLGKQVEVLRKIAHIFKSTSSAAQVRRILNTYLNKLEQSVSRARPDDPFKAFVLHVLGVADRYWHGLFHSYDNPSIPKTNNSMEQMFNIFKRHERKVSGRKSTVGGPVETCAPFVVEAWSTLRHRPGICEMFNQVPDKRLREALADLKRLAGPATKRRSIQRNPEQHLDEVMEKWLNP